MLSAGANKAGGSVARQRHLARAPITEALIDLRVSPREGLTFEELRAAFDAPDFGYYAKNPITQGTFSFKLTPEGRAPETAAESAQVGLRLHSEDERYVAQCALTGFTLSRLRPYENWERLRDEAQRTWSVYVERLHPQRVVRIATRFINNLSLPTEPGTSLQTYLHKLADVPEQAPQTVEAFFQRFQLVDAQSGARVILTLALDGNARGERVPVILDVDAVMSTSVDPRDPEVWNTLHRLRDLKNECFFGTITERAAELYE
jgi:uncharacterized protein (TIGR04255 family)